MIDIRNSKNLKVYFREMSKNKLTQEGWSGNTTFTSSYNPRNESKLFCFDTIEPGTVIKIKCFLAARK